ncbi:hypothetical protein NQ315_007748 [Exocentrus adspersus]|uniref:Sphingomyelin phosphodiesterase n=1 Tax=Exocentrus adspersus TaxID=1586481 RepID=A0AAV8W8V1_9CUCU|nr:hypothetical protein NQ315_007748 [Exocentrus adspersus]
MLSKSKWIGCFLFCTCVLTTSSAEVPNGFHLATKTLTDYLTIGVRPPDLDYALGQFPLPNVLVTKKSVLDSSQKCHLCTLLTDVLIMNRRLGFSDVQLASEASYLCNAMKMANERVCDGMIKNNVDIFTYIIDNNEDMSGSRICRLILRENECDSTDNYEWTIEVPAGKTVDKDKTKTNTASTTTFNILHISDIHYDPRYTAGKLNRCGEPTCCQDDNPDGTDDSTRCGYWSDYIGADLPFHTMQETLKQTTTHEFDYVYYTGDFVSHRVWSTSVENNTRDITAVTEQFRNYYNVPVYPVLGNHEPHPVNLWSSEGVEDGSLSTQWVFELVAEQWGGWLNEDAKQTILKGGYYTISPTKGFRVIVLNSNKESSSLQLTRWLINRNKDPYGQLTWLGSVLLQAEKAEEKVHVLMHIPSGDIECFDTWGREYRRIIRRFANTITGQFAGHTHRDELVVYYDDEEPSKAISMTWNGACVMSDHANPSYKVFQVDADTFDVVDYEEWTFNLTLANLDPTKDIEWYKLYSFKEAYGVESLQPGDVDKLLTRMTKDHSLIQKYYVYKFRNSDIALAEGCDETCEKNLLCDMVTTMYGDTEHCDILKQLYDENKQ